MFTSNINHVNFSTLPELQSGSLIEAIAFVDGRKSVTLRVVTICYVKQSIVRKTILWNLDFGKKQCGGYIWFCFEFNIKFSILVFVTCSHVSRRQASFIGHIWSKSLKIKDIISLLFYSQRKEKTSPSQLSFNIGNAW